MNAAFLLVATAFVTGSDPVQAVPAPVVAAPYVSSGCSSCDTGCNTGCNTCDGGHKLFGGFHLHSRSSDCGCDSCGGKHSFGGCGCGGGFSLGLKEKFSGMFGHHGCNTCDTCNDCGKSCGCGIMESPLSKLGGLFHKRNHGCSTCDTCNTCSSCGGAVNDGVIIQGGPPAVAPVPVQPGVKPVPAPAAPQKMPAAPPAKPTSQLTPTSTLIIE